VNLQVDGHSLLISTFTYSFDQDQEASCPLRERPVASLSVGKSEDCQFEAANWLVSHLFMHVPSLPGTNRVSWIYLAEGW
jgi:hypothetical protein